MELASAELERLKREECPLVALKAPGDYGAMMQYFDKISEEWSNSKTKSQTFNESIEEMQPHQLQAMMNAMAHEVGTDEVEPGPILSYAYVFRISPDHVS